MKKVRDKYWFEVVQQTHSVVCKRREHAPICCVGERGQSRVRGRKCICIQGFELAISQYGSNAKLLLGSLMI